MGKISISEFLRAIYKTTIFDIINYDKVNFKNCFFPNRYIPTMYVCNKKRYTISIRVRIYTWHKRENVCVWMWAFVSQSWLTASNNVMIMPMMLHWLFIVVKNYSHTLHTISYIHTSRKQTPTHWHDDGPWIFLQRRITTNDEWR